MKRIEIVKLLYDKVEQMYNKTFILLNRKNTKVQRFIIKAVYHYQDEFKISFLTFQRHNHIVKC